MKTIATPKPIQNTKPTKEYIAGSRGWGGAIRSLSDRFDDLSSELSIEIYSNMNKDDAVNPCLNTIKTSILAHGWRLNPADLSTDRKKKRAAKRLKWVDDQLKELQIPLVDVFKDMLDGLWCGNRLAELVWKVEKNQLLLAAIKPKFHNMTSFVVDQGLNIVGILVNNPNSPFPSGGSLIALDPKNMPKNIIDRSKVMIWTFSPKNSDPRGSSLYRAAYTPWLIKTQLIPEWLKYLSQFAGPSLVGILPPDGDGVNTDDWIESAEGQDFVSEAQSMLESILNLQNGSAVVFPAGSQLFPIPIQGNGEAFYQAFDYCNNRITLVILLQLLATSTAEYQTNASTKTHKTILDDAISAIKGSLERMFFRDVIKQMIVRNFGESELEYAPTLTLGETEEQDLAPIITSIAQLARAGYIHPSQYPGIDALLNLPPRDESQDDQEQAKPIPGQPQPESDDESDEDQDQDAEEDGSVIDN